MSLTMTQSERETFLSDLHVGVIAIERSDAPPLAVPIWYDFDPEIGVWVITESTSLKGRALQAAGRYTICAQSEEPPTYKYVSVEGPAEARPADLEKDLRPMAHRYFGPELGDLYLKDSTGAGQLVFTMTPERWRTVDYAKLGSA